MVGSDQRRPRRYFRLGTKTGAWPQFWPCPQTPARARGNSAVVSSGRQGRGEALSRPVGRGALGRAPRRSAELAGLALPCRKRGLAMSVIEAAAMADALREGPWGSAWFAYRDEAGTVVHVDIRGPAYKGSLTGGAESLFRLPSGETVHPRLVVAEAAIDALSIASLEALRMDTLYVATGGGMGPGTIGALAALLGVMSSLPKAIVCSAAGRIFDREFSVANLARLPTPSRFVDGSRSAGGNVGALHVRTSGQAAPTTSSSAGSRTSSARKLKRQAMAISIGTASTAK